MKLPFAISVALSAFVQADAVANVDWQPSASIEEMWRWNELDPLDGYGIYAAAAGVNGDIWFAYEDGLLNYDGREVSTYPQVVLQPDKTAILNVTSDGRVFWNNSNNLIIKDGENESLLSIEEFGFLVSDGFVEDQQGNVILARYDGLYLYRSGGLEKIASEPMNPCAIKLDASGNLWVAEDNSRLVRVFQLNLDGENSTTKLLHVFGENLPTDIDTKLFVDSRGRVWVFSPDADDICYYYENYQQKPGLTGLRRSSIWMQNFKVVELSTGEIWIAVHRKLGRFDGDNLTVYDIGDLPIPSTYPFMVGLPGDRILLGGINLVPMLIDLSVDRWVTYEDLNFQCEDLQGGWWFISRDRKVVRRLGQTWQVYESASELVDKPNRIIAGSDGSIWLSGSHNGIAAAAYFLDGDWSGFQFPRIGKVFSHLACLETKEGNFLFGGGTPTESEDPQADGGAVMFRKVGNRYEPVHLPPPTLIRRPANIVERRGDGLWLSMASIFKAYTPDSLTAQPLDLFTNQWVDHMIVDSNNDVWVACMGVGIYQYGKDGWTLHDRANGLDLRDTLYLLEDAVHGGILALGNSGFHRFDGDNWGHWDFSTNIPFKRENHAVFQSKDGAIWINYSSRNWYLENMSIDPASNQFRVIRYMPDNDPPETHASTLISEYSEGDQVHFRFDGFDLWNDTRVHSLMYSWRLNGSEWSEFTALSDLPVSDLKAGNYVLEVRARDKIGNIDPTPTAVVFQIVPPIWKQAWFVLLILAFLSLIVMLAYALFKVRVKAALAIDEFKLDFFTNISHELRNPLAVMITPIERLLRKQSDEDTHQNLQIVLRNARKMQGMIDQLLEFRKLEKGQWGLNPSGGEIISFIREAVYNEEPLWKAKGQELEFTASPDSFVCSFDAEIVQKIVDNLLSNAIKYSSENRSIRVSLDVTESGEHQEMKLVVEDQGDGIPLHEQQNILKPFYRIKRRSREEGSGIGLAFVNQLVNICGGSIHLQSPLPELDHGTRFTVSLPLEPFHEDSEAEFPVEIREGHLEGLPLVLIVEDNEDFRHVLSTELTDDYNLIEAENGNDGFAKASKYNPDLIISDVMMPGMDGYQLCEKLKSDPETSHIPVILLTAKSSVDHRIQGIKVGADAYIAKPLDVNHLIARMQNLLDSRRELKHKFASQIVVEPTELTVTPTDELILRKAIQIVDEHMQDEDFDVAHLSKLMGMSRSSLTRKLKAMTGQTPQPFIQKMRLKRAASLLSTGNLTVSDATAEVGIYDLSYFAKIFRKEFGVLPSNYEKTGTPSETLTGK